MNSDIITRHYSPSPQLDRVDLQLVLNAGEGEENFERGDTLQARIGELDMRGIDAGLVTGGVERDPSLVDVDLVPDMVSEPFDFLPRVVDVEQPDATRDGMPTARLIAAASTACSVQSPLRLSATSLAGAKATSKFLSLMFSNTQCSIFTALSQGERVSPIARAVRLLTSRIIARDHAVGTDELGIDLGRLPVRRHWGRS